MLDFLDIRTIAFIYFFLSTLLSVLYLLLCAGRRSYPGSLALGMSVFVISQAFILFTLQKVIPDFFSIFLFNVFTFSGMALTPIGFRLFMGLAPRYGYYSLIVSAASVSIFYFTMIDPSYIFRNFTADITYVLFCGETCYILYARCLKNLMLVSRVTGTVYLLITSFFSIRFSYFFIFRFKDLKYMTDVPGGELKFFAVATLLVALAVSVSAIFCFMTMVITRLATESKENENKFKSLFDFAPYPVALSDAANGLVIDVNNKCLEIFESDKKDVIGKTSIELGILTHKQREKIVKTVVKDKLISDFEIEFITRSGNALNLLLYSCMVEISGTPFLISAFIDNTLRFKYEKEILYSKRLLGEINAQKDSLLGVIAHDLLGPFSAVREMNKLLINQYDDFGPAEIKSSLEQMNSSHDKAYALLENLLNWSRAAADKIVFKPVELRPFQIVENIKEHEKDRIISKKIKFLNRLEDNLAFYCDENMFYSILRNLIVNAIKYSRESGEIVVGGSRDENNSIIWIKDEGIGMSEDEACKLFKPGKFLSREGTYGEKSFGFGLAIVYDFVTRHGGSVRVESAKDKGSTFFVTLPNRKS
ncbi:MAG TPA: HAMP domain-containing sensor histidine kinase [Candidatus Wallbacteria bacterium]|nr:HAMP domain-containing sensor histidine kinase [Candidatus Wallbacteria bacterium]